MLGGTFQQLGAQIRGAHDRPNIGLDAVTAQHLRGVQGRDAEADVADIPTGGKILVGKDYLHLLEYSPQIHLSFSR